MSFFMISCTKKKQDSDIVAIPQKEWLPNMDDRIKREAAEGRGLLGRSGIIGGNQSGGNIKFANANLMWKASLKVLEEIPLINVDYAGGIIVTDWYGGAAINDKSEQIKITVKFLSDEITSSSFQIINHKKTCINNSCVTELGKNSLNEAIKEKIVASARVLSIEEEKAKK